jgi:predicted nucleotide-binding protein
MARSRRQRALYGEPGAPVPALGPPALAQPRAEASQKLEDRIAHGIEIQDRSIQSRADMESYKADTKKWQDYNVELLRRLFTDETIANEYVYACRPTRAVRDEIDRLRGWQETVNNQITKLESIRDRLDLYAEPARQATIGVEAEPSEDRSKVFVVHGHDEGAREGVARFLEKIGLKAIVLREQPNRGRTIIEKFVDCAREVGFAVVLLTPDDLGGPAATEVQQSRARQNVIFELGYFVGSLGRGRACLLRKGDVEIPSDLYGVVYTDMDGADGWKIELARELKDAGFEFDASKGLA